MDIVYLVKECQTDEELTYSLRSLVNLPHGKVFLVGGCPGNIDKGKVIHCPIIQRNNKFQNTQNGLKYICKDNRLSEDFILMNDDFFILQPVKDPVAELNLCRGPIQEVLAENRRRNGFDNEYTVSMAQTDLFLRNLGYNAPLSYELHIPMVLNKKRFVGIFDLPNIESIKPGQQRSLYGNLYLTGSKVTKDVKVYFGQKELPTGKFLSTEDNSWPFVKEHLSKLFPDKSPYEL